MPWAALISALISWLGPVLLDWIKAWLDRRLNAAAEVLPAFESYGDENAARNALFDKALDQLPVWAFARKAFLRRAKHELAVAGVTSTSGSPMSQEAADTLTELAGSVDRE